MKKLLSLLFILLSASPLLAQSINFGDITIDDGELFMFSDPPSIEMRDTADDVSYKWELDSATYTLDRGTNATETIGNFSGLATVLKFNSSDEVFLPTLANCDTVDTDSDGKLTCGTDSGDTDTSCDGTSCNLLDASIVSCDTIDTDGSGNLVCGVDDDTPDANEIQEFMLKAVDTAGDEQCLTYEATVGDFEWQDCDGTIPGQLGDLSDVTTTIGVAGDILLHDGVDSYDNKAMSGDATISSAGVIEVTQADALESNPTNCSAGNFPLGISQTGAAESCTDAITETELDSESELEAQLIGVDDVFTDLDGALDDDDLTDNVINDLSDVVITSAASGHILIHDGIDSFDNVPVTGDVGLDASGITYVEDNSHDHNSLTDIDADTLIQVEQSLDEDTIRFDVGGTEQVVIDSSGDVTINQQLAVSSNSIGTADLYLSGDMAIGASYSAVSPPANGLAVAGTVNIGNSSLTDQLGVHNSNGARQGLYVRNTNSGNIEHVVYIEDSYTGSTFTSTRPVVQIYRDDNDVDDAAGINFSLEDSAGNEQNYGGLAVRIKDQTSTTEDGEIVFYVTGDGTQWKEQMIISDDQVQYGPDALGNFSMNIDKLEAGTATWTYKNAGTDNATVQLSADEELIFAHRILDKNIIFKTTDSTNGSHEYMNLNPDTESVDLGVDTNVTGTLEASVDVTIGGTSVCQSDGTNCLAASGEWTDTGTIVHPNESTVDEVAIGGTTEAGADIFLGVDGTAVFNEQGASVDFKIEGNILDPLFFVDGSADKIGINENTPAAKLHIVGVTDGTDPSIGAGTVAIVEDGGASGAYVSIISAANNVSGINFGDPSDENVGSIEYNNSDNSLTFDTGTSVDMLHIDQYGSIGMGTTSPAEKLHIVGTTDGTDPSFSTASQLLIEDQFSGGAGLTILSANIRTGEINFADPDSGTAQRIRYDHSADTMTFRTGGTDALTLQTAGNALVGNSLFLNEQAAADADVAGDGQIWVKNDTPNTLYFTDDAGNDTQLGVGGTNTVYINGGTSGTSAATRYVGVAGTDSNATESNAQTWRVPVAGNITQFNASVDSAPGGASQWTVTVRENGISTTASCTITGSATSCEWTGTEAVLDNATIAVLFEETISGASGTRMAFSITYEP